MLRGAKLVGPNGTFLSKTYTPTAPAPFGGNMQQLYFKTRNLSNTPALFANLDPPTLGTMIRKTLNIYDYVIVGEDSVDMDWLEVYSRKQRNLCRLKSLFIQLSRREVEGLHRLCYRMLLVSDRSRALSVTRRRLQCSCSPSSPVHSWSVKATIRPSTYH